MERDAEKTLNGNYDSPAGYFGPRTDFGQSGGLA